ncbi:hypothetical protein CCMSSC00406_0008812 [Pleurotus cornucopiae]|uniref:Uncharacterized protein n=1 Tax=Pleurotus cornucopiae TaxID=5321 RepID=A0ACB7IJC0_PLECO|nr:hypothetical protein CCMSSC00406_0008812 [Pleurotus cornucopiae]
MVDDKYIGLALAVSSSLAIGTSFIITKKGLNDAGQRAIMYGAPSASDDHSYLRNATWWAGMILMILGELANFSAYTFAPPILVTPLGALSVLIGAVLASFLLKEELGHLGRLGCTLCLLGSLIIVLHAPEDKPVETVDEILHYAIQPGFLMYCFTVLVFALVMIYAVSPRYGRSNPLVYISICSLVGSVSVMAIKGFGIAVKLTFAGKNQFSHPSTYVFGIVVVVCILVQMNYFNKALDTFSTNVVNPLYYVGFSTSTIVASLILFQGFNTTDATNTVSLLCGFIVTFLGVYLLNFSRNPDPPPGQEQNGHAHSALESGLMNPRLSLQGRASIDGWHAGESSVPRGHIRRLSGATTLFNAYEEDRDRRATEHVGLQELRELDESDDDDDDDDDDVDERTHLNSASVDKSRKKDSPPIGNGHLSRHGSRSNSHSPSLSLGDGRRGSPRL